MKKYQNTTKEETVIIRRSRKKLIALPKQDDLPDDFARGITKDELMEGIRTGIKEMFRKKSE